MGKLQNLDVSESALKHKHMEKNLGSIRGRQATVDALIGNEHYPTIRRLRTHSELATKPIRILGVQERESKRVTDDSISSYASSRQVATKKLTDSNGPL